MINPLALHVELSASDPQNRQEVLTRVGIRTEETLSGCLGGRTGSGGVFKNQLDDSVLRDECLQVRAATGELA